MTDEELHRLEIRYSDMESWDDAKRLVTECVRLRAREKRLAEAAMAAAFAIETTTTDAFAKLVAAELRGALGEEGE